MHVIFWAMQEFLPVIYIGMGLLGKMNICSLNFTTSATLLPRPAEPACTPPIVRVLISPCLQHLIMLRAFSLLFYLSLEQIFLLATNNLLKPILILIFPC